MSYEEGFEAVKKGDFRSALPLLENAARETEYNSESVNHAYTLALHLAGDRERLADISFGIGILLLEDDPASAMDYFQRALFAGLDSAREREIGEIFEGWAVPRGASSLDGRTDRAAHVIGSLLPGQSPTQYLKMLVWSLKRQGVESPIFTTESSASWFFNAAGTNQSQPMDLSAEVQVASVEGNFLQRAEKVASAIRNSGIKVSLFHGNLSDQITARVAAMRPAPVQINVNHGSEMDADLFDGFIHLFQNALERSRFASHPSEWIPLASDIETRLQMSVPVTRQAMGLESASSISATFGNLDKVSGSGYIRALTEILQRFPNHFHLFAGGGNVRVLRSALHSEGVLSRVRFLGQIGDIAPILETIDLYMASFPNAGGRSLLEAMGAGKPIVVLRNARDSHDNSVAGLVGVEELSAHTEVNYIDIADRLLRNSELRARYGEASKQRFRTEFCPERLGERYVEFISRFNPKT